MHDEDAHHPNHSLQDKLQRIYTLRRNGRVNFDDSTHYRELLTRLGDPHTKLAPIIHLAGTNGKGSTLATLRAIYEQADYRVQAYTSPHLRIFNERIYLPGGMISDQELENTLDEVLQINQDNPVTFFELTTALAFLVFSRHPADLVLLETGMGGRLDCTNVIESPLATIITAISYDHMEFLGDTLPAIAREKAGIMKPHVPCFIAQQEDPALLNVFKQKAAQLPCPLYLAGTDWTATAADDHTIGFAMPLAAHAVTYPRPNLIGAHQIDNSGTALAVIQTLQATHPVSAENIAAGLQKIIWPGRLERRPSSNLPQNWELWFDGGHNVSGARAIVAVLTQWQQEDPKPLHIILGMREGKDISGVTKILSPYSTSFTSITVGDDIEPIIQNLAKDNPSPAARILICGSFYTYF